MLEFWPDYLFDTTIYSTLKTCQPCINRRIGMDQFGSRWSVFPRVSFLNNQSWHPSGIDILKLWSRIIGMLGKPLVRIFPDQAAPLYIHCLGGSANSDIYTYTCKFQWYRTLSWLTRGLLLQGLYHTTRTPKHIYASTERGPTPPVTITLRTQAHWTQ